MSIQIHHYKLSFLHPLVTAKGVYSTREGLLLSLSLHGKTCWSEVSPLPGFSVTTLEECHDWLKINKSSFSAQLIDRIDTTSAQNNMQDVVKFINSITEPEFPPDTPPEINFAFDTLFFQGICQISNLETENDIKIGVNATASDLNSAQLQIKNGYQTIKLKVGLDWPTEINTILILRSQYPKIRIRLDANESWSVDEAKLRLQELENLNVEYVEQPVKHSDLLEYGNQFRTLGTAIAADESARNLISIQELIRNHSVDVFILKPPMLGSFKMIQEVCSEIKAAGCRMTFTSSLDSSINVSMSALISSIWSEPGDMHGFSTGNLFVQDINQLKPTISNSVLTLDSKWIINPESNLNKALVFPKN